ncbi:hypothetical protein GCM10007036_16670 [Alsobacter metallidurans]|uniref:Uncharacterized protein n=1 Tax=Alsobacter metallidurans TaxID=340221 RepID=A0A917I6K7_9HYPH|nr:hypothetical protein [Alsobacter metallidurans]GGH16181.1 hypothetical protein GCM10007036_16670 [Alsobacter metallidurans]
MATFKIGLVSRDFLYGDCFVEFVAEVDGITFYDACQRHADTDAAFRESFDQNSMMCRGHRLVSLDHYAREKLKAPL